MTFHRDIPDDMASTMETELADALLDRRINAGTAAGYEGVGELLQALDRDLDGELDPERLRTTVDAMAAAIEALPTSSGVPAAARAPAARMPTRRFRMKAVGLELTGAIVATGGVAFAG